MAVAWVTLSVADLLSTITAPERNLFGRAGAEVDVPDRAAPILADVANEVRGYIQSADANVSGVDTDASKIPPSMRARALDLARYRLLASVPSYKMSEARTEEYRAALRFFERVAEGKIRAEASTTAQDNPTPPATHHRTEVVNDVTSRTGRSRMSGL